MPPKKKEEVNPLLSRNIPPPPLSAVTELGTNQSQAKNGKTASEENSIRGERQMQGSTTNKNTKPEEERATIELSLYLRPTQDDKLEDLRRAYKRHTGKKISANEVMRRLIDHATLDTLLEVPE
jgi:hypothetical protein